LHEAALEFARARNRGTAAIRIAANSTPGPRAWSRQT
jgi:hypothetical protein